jgi:hypothetical protein
MENEMDDITRRALHAGVVINSLDAKGLFSDEPLPPAAGMDPRSITRLQLLGTVPKDLANDSLAALAYNTGGLFFHNNNDLSAGFHELGMRPEVSYLLGFAPGETPDGKYHRLRVRIKAPGHNTVQARLGYMAVEPRQAAAQPPRRIDTVAAADTVLRELPGSLTSQVGQTDTGESGVTVVFHIDVKQLRFTGEAGMHQQQLALIAMLLDSGGAFVAGKESTVVLALKEPTFALVSPGGMNFRLTLPAPAGSYRLRAVMGDSVEGKVTASTLPVEIR